MTQLSSIDMIEGLYRTIDPKERNRYIYNLFTNLTRNDERLSNSFFRCQGFGELAFCWNWKLLVDAMPKNFKFLEVGVYKGRVLGQVGFCANRTGKTVQLYGVTPLSTMADKYSVYDESSYREDIMTSLRTCGVGNESLQLIVGTSQDPSVLDTVRSIGQYDMIFIDGCHDYEVVVQDIKEYLPLVKTGGYFIMDDSSLYIDHPFGQFLGHPDVSRAANEFLTTDPSLRHVYAVGHNRVWKKVKTN